MRNYIANVLLAATSLALFWLFGCILIEGSHYIQEPSILILIIETTGIVAIFSFAIYNLVRFAKRPTSATGFSNYVRGDTSHDSRHIVFYTIGGKALTPIDINSVEEIVAKATGRDKNIIFGVGIEPKLDGKILHTVSPHWTSSLLSMNSKLFLPIISIAPPELHFVV